MVISSIILDKKLISTCTSLQFLNCSNVLHEQYEDLLYNIVTSILIYFILFLKY